MYLKRVIKREVLPSDLNRLNPILKAKHIGTFTKVKDSSVLSLHKDYVSIMNRFCDFYNLPKEKEFQTIIFNILLRTGSREYALNHRTKNLPEGYFCIPLNANKYTLDKQHPVFEKSLKNLGKPISYRQMRRYFDYIKACPAFVVEKGKFTFGKDGEGNIAPSEDNTMTRIRYIGSNNDPFLDRGLPDSSKKRIENFKDYVLLKTIGKLLLKKKISEYDTYKSKFIGSAIIKHSKIHYKTGKKSYKATNKPLLSFGETDSYSVEQINKTQRNLIKNDTVFEEIRVTRIFKDDEGFGGRFYSNFHRWSSDERKKATSYLGYQEYDLTASMINQRRIWDKNTLDINEDLDVYLVSLKITGLFCDKKNKSYDDNKLNYYRPIIKSIMTKSLGACMYNDSVNKFIREELIKTGVIYDTIDTNKLAEIKNSLLLKGMTLEEVYKDPLFQYQRSICANNRNKRKKAYQLKHSLKNKHSLTLKDGYRLIKEIRMSLNARFQDPIHKQYMLQAQDAESMATLRFMKFKTSKGLLALTCHDSIYTNNEFEFSFFKNLVKVNTLKVKRNEDISLNPEVERKSRRPRISKESTFKKVQKERFKKINIGYIGNLYNNTKNRSSSCGPPE